MPAADPQPLVLPATPAADPMPVDRGSLFVIGNATVLLRFGGFTLLTDPSVIHKHEQTWLGYGLHTTCLTDPACEIADLPPLDLIVLSHFHGDHFDQAAEEGLDRSLPIVTPPQSAALLAARGFANGWPIDRRQTQVVRKGDAELRITAMPGHHGPPLVDAALPDVMGSLLAFGRAGQAATFQVYISGDTLLIDDLAENPQRHPEIDLALLHLGGTRALGILVSMDAEQGVKCRHLVNSRRAVPIHFDDYDVFKSPLADFQAAVAAAGWADRVTYPDRGDTLALGRGGEARVAAGLGPRGTPAFPAGTDETAGLGVDRSPPVRIRIIRRLADRFGSAPVVLSGAKDPSSSWFDDAPRREVLRSAQNDEAGRPQPSTGISHQPSDSRSLSASLPFSRPSQAPSRRISSAASSR